MTKRSLLSTWKHLLTEPAYPGVGIEINSDCVRLAVVSVQKTGVHIEHLDSFPLPDQAVSVNPLKPNINNVEAVAEALKALWMRNRNRSPKICLLLQDRAALTFSLTLEQAPENRRECLELVRFKLKKSIPFRIEEAQINYFLETGEPDYQSSNLWVTVMNRDVLAQYEQLIESSINCECGLVDLVTLNFMNLADAEIRANGWQGEDHLYINLNRNYISIAITQKDRLVFYRSREMEHQDGILDEAMAEIHPTTMFYQDKLGGEGFKRAFVYAVEKQEELSRNLERIHNLSVANVSPAGANRDSRTFAPLLGLLMSRKLEFL